MPRQRNVNFGTQARKNFEALDERTKARVADSIRELADNPLAGKKLKGEFSAYRSYRLGAYRIIYRFSQTLLEIASIEHRKDVYR